MTKANNEVKDSCKVVDRKKDNLPVENHVNAAWAEIHRQDSEGKVPIPSIENVEEAKDWVDENKK